MNYNINNKPASADNYEFIVARKVDNEFWFFGAYSDGFKAGNVASALEDGVVFHNVHIQGKRK